MNEQISSYGLWGLVLFNSAFFIMFAFSFFKPRSARDWRSCQESGNGTIHLSRMVAR